MQAKTCHQDVLKLNNRSRGGINFVSYISGRKPSIFQILWLFHDCNHNHGKSSSNPFYTSWEDEEAKCNQYNQEAQFHSMYCSSKNMEVFLGTWLFEKNKNYLSCHLSCLCWWWWECHPSFLQRLALQCLSSVLRTEKNNPRALMFGSALLIPFQPMIVTALHTSLLEVVTLTLQMLHNLE